MSRHLLFRRLGLYGCSCLLGLVLALSVSLYSTIASADTTSSTSTDTSTMPDTPVPTDTSATTDTTASTDPASTDTGPTTIIPPRQPISQAGDPQCVDPVAPATRNPANPLMLSPAPTGNDPLRGAHFFTAGPRYGTAAVAIARIISGLPPGTSLIPAPLQESWAQFSQTVAAALPGLSPAAQSQVMLLEKIAEEPQVARISAYSGGGSPQGLYSQMRHLFCDVLQADPDSIPVISTYLLHATLGGCADDAQINAYRPQFESQVNAIAQAVDRRPAVLLVEIDGVGSSSCMAKIGSLPEWESMLRYEALRFESLPHTAVFLEGGYSDAETPAYAAQVLNAAGVRRIQGFFTNDTHENWTLNEVRYASAVSGLTGRAHFIVNTAINGRGPLRNRDPQTQGLNDLCNPPGRGLGPRDTTTTGWSAVDALMWTLTPGASSGPCNGGPPSGRFWPAYAEQLASRANGRYGPAGPSRPY